MTDHSFSVHWYMIRYIMLFNFLTVISWFHRVKLSCIYVILYISMSLLFLYCIQKCSIHKRWSGHMFVFIFSIYTPYYVGDVTVYTVFNYWQYSWGGGVAHSSIKFNCQLKLIGQIFPINFNWRCRDFTCKFNRQLNLIDDGATEFI